MKIYEFTLHFKLPANDADPTALLDPLFEAGCCDATVGIGRPGFIALAFARAAKTPSQALLSAIADVKRGIPGCEFVAAR
ncbi:MAG: DNA-binding protein [Azospirillum sp.]|nr:DNA-binding protein [Azospirillum sp.]